MQRAAPFGGLLLFLMVTACDHAASESAVPAPSAVVPPEAGVSAPATAALVPLEASAPTPLAPAPAVTVENIGMHIGGGPNDEITKAPIGGSVAPHFDELRACWAQIDDPTRGGDFGVDLLIPADGGRATVSHPRSILGPQAFRDCVVAVFTGIDFAKPRTGRTTVSYALRFMPRR